MTERDYRRCCYGKAKKKKYSASDKAILGIGYVLLGAFVLSILVPLFICCDRILYGSECAEQPGDQL